VGLIQIYEVDGKSFLLFPKWDKHQRIRAKRSKYPAPDSKILTPDNICRHLTAYDDICVRNPIQFESNSNLNPNPIQEVVAAAPSSSLSENENSEKEWHVDNQLLKTILEKTEIPFSARKTWFAEVDLIIYEDKIKIVPRGEFGSYVAGQINNVFLDKLKTAFLAEGYKQEIICEVET
jgi:hypothetical protein